MNRRWRWHAWTAAAALWLAAAAAHAADLHAYTEPLPPLNYEEAGEARGFRTELLRTLAQRAGLSLQIDVLPWPRAVLMAAGDPSSVLYTLTRNAEREAQYQWIGPIARRRIVLYRLAERQDVQVRNLEDLARIRTAVARESATATMLQARGLGQHLEAALDDDSTMRMLIAHRVDAVAMLDFAAAWHSSRQGPGFRALRPLITLDDRHEYYFGLNRDAPPELAARLQQALDDLKRDGGLQQLTQRYLQ